MSDRKLISSGSPFEKANGYSRAVVTGDEVHIAGTTGYDYAKMAMPDDVVQQTRNIYATFAKVMKEAGGRDPENTLASIDQLPPELQHRALAAARLAVRRAGDRAGKRARLGSGPELSGARSALER